MSAAEMQRLSSMRSVNPASIWTAVRGPLDGSSPAWSQEPNSNSKRQICNAQATKLRQS